MFMKFPYIANNLLAYIYLAIMMFDTYLHVLSFIGNVLFPIINSSTLSGTINIAYPSFNLFVRIYMVLLFQSLYLKVFIYYIKCASYKQHIAGFLNFFNGFTKGYYINVKYNQVTSN